MAAVLGKTDDAAMYEKKAAAVQRALHRRFYEPATTATPAAPSRTWRFRSCVNIVPPDLRPAVHAEPGADDSA